MTKVFVNGCFDILHPGHLVLLSEAASFGDELTVAIDSDERVRSHKGPDRPAISQRGRAFMLRRIKGVDHVYVFDTDEELQDLVEWCKPDVMVVGADWKGKPIIGSEWAGEVRYVDRVGEWSTTKIIEDCAGR